ncbi:unnamed protein product [Chironomus riparius]|uniref:Uncharacterized protein n=1 Tax=Chironomus riparius TaxID=315576 RepID=A0A9P0J752_9DIPT|nr:unnamed protein product [Chironomus riparius]
MNNNMRKHGIKYVNIDANKGGIYVAQDAGMKDNRQSLDNRNEILQPSENTVYELYTPLVSIYRSYPVDLNQQQLKNDIEHHLFGPEQRRVLDALFSIESVPFPNPLIFLSEPSPLHQQQHSNVNIPTNNLRRFYFPSFEQSFTPSFGNSYGVFPQNGGFPSFPQSDGFSLSQQNGRFPSFPQNIGFSSLPQNGGYQYKSSNGFPSFPQNIGFSSLPQNGGYQYKPSNGFPSFQQGGGYHSYPLTGGFPSSTQTRDFPSFSQDMNSMFNYTFDPKRFKPVIIQDSMMKDENGKTPDLIQVGNNNFNIKSSTQHGIVQVNPNWRKTEMPIITTTEYPDIDETSTLQDETTTFLDESIDRIDEILKESLVGK